MIKQEKELLYNLIKELSQELNVCINNPDICSEYILELAQQLDVLITEYNNLTSY